MNPRPTRRRQLEILGAREAQALAAVLGREIQETRRALGLTQRQVAARIRIHQSWYGEMERGGGAGVPLDGWVALGFALKRPFAAGFSKAIEPADLAAGHLAVQELVLRLARAQGIGRTFELRTRSTRSIDVGLRDDLRRVLSLIEIWNTIPDVAGAKRDTDRKVEEVREVAAALEPSYRVASCWVVRATAANRALLARYPNVFETAFPGSSRGWVAVLQAGGIPPTRPGLIWADVPGTRLFEWRRR